MTKEFLLHKLDLLNISLEILTSWHGNKNISQKFYILHSKIRNQEYNKRQRFIFLIKYVYYIIFTIDKYEVNKLANKVIKGEQKFFEQYISKFLYTYYKNKKYYINNKFISYKIKDKKIIAKKTDAILQLYIISKLNKTQGIYRLIKYLR